MDDVYYVSETGVSIPGVYDGGHVILRRMGDGQGDFVIARWPLTRACRVLADAICSILNQWAA